MSSIQVTKFCITIMLALFYSFNSMCQTKVKFSSWIEKETQTEQHKFMAFFKNESNDSIKDLSYNFNGWKKSESGKSTISQSGKFEIKAGEKINLATIKVNRAKGENETIKLELEIYQKKSLIITDTLELGP